MSRLRERTLATLLIAIFMISTFAIVMPVSAVNNVLNVNTNENFSTIQAAIDDSDTVDGHTLLVAAGIYAEQVLIDKSLTLDGAGDTTIIKPSGPGLTATSNIPWIGTTHAMAAIVSVETTGGTVIIKDLKIDWSSITSKSTTWIAGLVYIETSGKVEGITVIGNPALPDRTAGIFAGAVTHTSSLDVTGCTVEVYTRAGIYALGDEITANYHHNVINGPGPIIGGVPNGMFFLEGALGSATYNIITDFGYTGATYRSTGIGTFRPGSGVTFGHNEISNVQNAFAIAGGSGATIEYNDIHDCHTGVKLEAVTYWTPYDRARNVMIQYNDIYDNDFAIRCGGEMGSGNEAHYNNIFGNLGASWFWNGETYVGDVSNVHATETFDATLNWWGHASGPSGDGGRKDSEDVVIGKGDSVSDNVDWDPWLPQPVGHTKHNPTPPGLKNKK